ncbi:ABC transporter ATP-binding protein [Thermodesulfatator atlanticus]|uniref:ABC transporter ATP-binding protein n=1 Tax=Thermodesulfatator atlanticus TaxID=501497 RepID=UPI0003B6FC6D|nr:ABC transporter transmembrane domain-containing protein [Thermodesulfatator atlanticus]
MKKTILKLWFLIRPYWPLIFVSILFSSIASIFSGSIAWLVKPVLDRIFLEKNYIYLKLIPLGIVGIYFLRGLAVFLQAYFMRIAALRLVNDLRQKIYEKILNLPVGLATRETSGRLISRVINDTSLLEGALTDIFRTFFLEGLTVLILVGVAFWRRWDLTLFAFTVFPLVAIASRKLAQKTHRVRHLAQQEMANVTNCLAEGLSGLKDVKIFQQENYMKRRFNQAVEAFYRFSLKLTKYNEGTKFVVNLLAGVGGGLVFAYGGHLIIIKVITPGDFFSVLTAILMIFNPIKKLSSAYNKAHDALAAVERLEEVLKLPQEKEGQKEVNAVKKGFRYEKVTFCYPNTEEPALRGVNFFIPAGKIVALVGPSGAGKTSLVSLLPRFYDPTSGRVTLDDTDLRELKLSSLRRLIGIVSQDIILFNVSVAENIAFGKPGATREEIIRAAKMAHAHEFIQELPQGYDTILGEKGVDLSGGQKQRIAIARAILKDPPVLILDEATSHLDTVSERLVHEALEKLMQGRTTIIIAHRLSTITKADIIAVMDKGNIVATGKHDELLQKSELYQRLYSSFQE